MPTVRRRLLNLLTLLSLLLFVLLAAACVRSYLVGREYLMWGILIVFGFILAVVTVWVARYAVGVNKLSRGIGQTYFYGADGKAWFPLEEHRVDVPLARIAPDLQHAVVAIEDHRFYSHPGVDPIGIGRAVVHDLRAGGRAPAECK